MYVAAPMPLVLPPRSKNPGAAHGNAKRKIAPEPMRTQP